MGCKATAKVLSTTIARSWAARGIGAAPDSGTGPLYGDRARLRLGWDMSLWGYRELETSSPTAASLEQGVRAWGLTWGCGPWALLGKPQEAVRTIGDPVSMTVKSTLTPAGQQFFAPHTPGPSHQILLALIFLCHCFFCNTLELLLSQLYIVSSSCIILFSLLTSLLFLFNYRSDFFHFVFSYPRPMQAVRVWRYGTWETKVGSLTTYTCCW